MKFTVKTKEGELQFSSFGEVERAWLLGLVGPDDDVLEEGRTKWRKAGSIPLLAQARRTGEQAWGGTWLLWAVLAIGVGSYALYQLKLAKSPEDYILPGFLGLATALLTIHVSVRAAKRAKPHG